MIFYNLHKRSKVTQFQVKYHVDLHICEEKANEMQYQFLVELPLSTHVLK